MRSNIGPKFKVGDWVTCMNIFSPYAYRRIKARINEILEYEPGLFIYYLYSEDIPYFPYRSRLDHELEACDPPTEEERAKMRKIYRDSRWSN